MADEKIQEQKQDITHLVCVGAVYIDTILTIPHFPPEDTKLRATSLLKRRGGNTPNTLEVLSQLVHPTSSTTTSSLTAFPSPSPPLHLHLFSTLPSPSCPDTSFIQHSLPHVSIASTSLFRDQHAEAASSYILQSAASLSRTIVSINPLPEMTFSEFVSKIEERKKNPEWENAWFHFEGRNPDVVVQCVRYLRSEMPRVEISLECEKPERRRLEGVLGMVDVMFFSRVWAEGRGYKTAKAFLASLLDKAKEGGIVCCTWGEGGAAGMKVSGGDVEVVEVQAWSLGEVDGGVDGEGDGKDNKRVVDTIGAGDTFIAGMLYAVIRHAEWGLKKQIEFANQIAGRKVLQEGFGELGEKMGGFEQN